MTNTPTGKGIGPRTLSDLNQWANTMALPVYVALQLLQSAEADKLSGTNGDAKTSTEDMLPPLNVTPRIKNGLLDFVNLLDAFIRAREEMTLVELFDYVLDKSGYETMLRDGSEEGEDRWRNVQELRSVCSEYNHLPGGEGLAHFLEDSIRTPTRPPLSPCMPPKGWSSRWCLSWVWKKGFCHTYARWKVKENWKKSAGYCM
jgi:DNA helicase-2/ATP-dependent DNA helicase PcrA